MTFAAPVDDLNIYLEKLVQLKTGLGQNGMAQKADALQQFFKQTLWAQLTQSEFMQQAQWRSAVTEMHRHMRLLTLEISFAKSAGDGDNRQQRLRQIEQRLGHLQEFAQGLITLGDG